MDDLDTPSPAFEANVRRWVAEAAAEWAGMSADAAWVAEGLDEREAREAQAHESWRAIDLSALSEEPPARPDLAPGFPLIYPGHRHLISGPPESVKTLIEYLAVLLMVRAGRRCAILNFEMGERPARQLLRELGASEQEIRSVAYYCPEVSPERTDIESLQAADFDYILYDAGAGAYGLEGSKDNDRNDIEAFTQKWINPFWRAGTATGLIDHEPKRGTSAIGSERKQGTVEVHLRFEAKKKLARGGHGIYRIHAEKDRPGYIREQAPVWELELWSAPVTNAITWSLKPLATSSAPGDFRPTQLMERVSLYVQVNDGCSKSKVREDVSGNAAGILQAITKLVEEEFVEVRAVGQKHHLHHVRPFTVAGD
jgi:hypothetical protein